MEERICEFCDEYFTGKAVTHIWDEDVYVPDFGEVATLMQKTFCSEGCKFKYLDNQKQPMLTDLQKDLETFRFNYPSINVSVLDDCLLYRKIPFGYVSDAVIEANELIKILGLNLVAVSNATNGLFTDSFIVKGKSDYPKGS